MKYNPTNLCLILDLNTQEYCIAAQSHGIKILSDKIKEPMVLDDIINDSGIEHNGLIWLQLGIHYISSPQLLQMLIGSILDEQDNWSFNPEQSLEGIIRGDHPTSWFLHSSIESFIKEFNRNIYTAYYLDPPPQLHSGRFYPHIDGPQPSLTQNGKLIKMSGKELIRELRYVEPQTPS